MFNRTGNVGNVNYYDNEVIAYVLQFGILPSIYPRKTHIQAKEDAQESSLKYYLSGNLNAHL